MTKSKKEIEDLNKTSLKLYADTSHITTMGELNYDKSIKGSKYKLRFTQALDPNETNMLEIRTTYNGQEFDLMLISNTLIQKRFYKHAQQLRRIMHPYDGIETQRISSVRISPAPNNPICFKIKDAINGEPALWFVVSPVVNKELTNELLEQVKRVAE